MRWHALLLWLCTIGCAFAASPPTWHEQARWSEFFAEAGVAGTIVVYDETRDRWLAFDRERAQARFSPASTFKVLNAVAALETGALKDEYDVIRWDGKDRGIADWNRDQSLASGMKFSAVWFYQEVARRVGATRMQALVDRAGYGNRDTSGGIDRFWLSGGLRISAGEQIDFLRRLAAGSLPFAARSQEAVRRITIMEAAPDYVLHAKSGWAMRADTKAASDIGWYVGWVERGGRRWFFALNIDMPDASAAPKRSAIARRVLTDVGALGDGGGR